jgi:hypothetical protein
MIIIMIMLVVLVVTVVYVKSQLNFTLLYPFMQVSNPIRGLDRSLGFQEDEVPRFLDSRHMRVVRLSALCTGRLYPPGNTPSTHFC